MIENIKVTETKISNTKLKLEFEISKMQVCAETEKVFNEIQKTASIHGFRQGKVPLKIIKEKYVTTARQRIIENLLKSTLNTTLKEKNINFVTIPKVEKYEFEFDKPFTYTAIVEHHPEIVPKNYKGLKLTKKIKAITEKDILQYLETLRKRNAELLESESGVATENSCVVVDYTVWSGETELKQLNAENMLIDLSEKHILPNLIEGLVNCKGGEYREIISTLPKQIVPEELKQYADKEIILKVTVKTVKEKKLPELNDEFAKDLQCNSVEELKSKIKAKLQEQAERDAEQKLIEQINDILINTNPVDVPETLLNEHTKNLYNSAITRLKLQGITDEFIEKQKANLYKQLSQEAERELKISYILNSISRQENIEVSPDEVNKHKQEILNLNPGKEKAVETYFKNFSDDLTFKLKTAKIYDYIKQNAKIKIEKFH